MTIKGFNPNGEIITKGYAQIHLPVESGPRVKEANIFSIYREQRWFERLFRFLEPNPLALDEKDFERIIAKGEGREVEKIRSIGKIRIRAEALKRNYVKFGYK
jgi:B9 domain-containing protein 1